MKRSTLSLGLALVLLISMSSFGAVPQLINFQGILKDGSGNPVSNGNYSVIFTIYDAPAGGTVQWAETTSVTTSTGLFTILLGDLNPVPDSAFNDSSRYLGVKVGADPEMSPRQKLVSVPFATGNWSTTGNGGTEAGRNFLGTTDNQPFELKVNGLRALRIEPTNSDNSPNWIAGFSSNFALAGVVGATISGGGLALAYNPNRVLDNFGTVGGGANNIAGDIAGTVNDERFATVCGGVGNRASGAFSTVCGGGGNWATGHYSFAAGRRAQANHSGTFVWADTGDAVFGTDFASTAPNQFLIRASGGVGIGTNNPLGLLHLKGGNYKMLLESSGNADVVIGRADATRYGNYILADGDPSNFANNRWAIGLRNGDSKLHLYDEPNGLNVMVLEPGGRVGIGTTSPEEGLHIGGSPTESRILLSNGGDLMWESTTGANTPVLTLHSDDNVYLDAQAATTSDLVFRTNITFTERMRISDAGNIGIGTTAPASRLQVNGALATAVTAVTVNTVLNEAHSVVLASTPGVSDVVITLPTAVGIAGRQYTIKKTDAAAHTVIVDANGAETIDGSFLYNLTTFNKYVTLVSNGANWFVIANN